MSSNPARPDPTYVSLARNAFKGDMLGLFGAGEEVAQLLAHPGWAHVTALLEARAADVGGSMNHVLLGTRADYAWKHGLLAGLEAMTEAARAIVDEAARQLAEQQRKHEGASEYAPLEA